MSTHNSARARRMDEARRSLKAAMITISHAQTAALRLMLARTLIPSH